MSERAKWCIKEGVISEGGDKYTDDPHDPGGPTKYGISQRFLKQNGYEHSAEFIKNMSEEFAINIYVKHFWNKHYDKRLGNTENHPTQDVHLNQIGLEDMWKFAINKYISPLIWKIYKYAYKKINISFIVKYSMDGQKELRPHHDSSAFTTNICLNDDFEGGGCHFIRQDKKKSEFVS